MESYRAFWLAPFLLGTGFALGAWWSSHGPGARTPSRESPPQTMEPGEEAPSRASSGEPSPDDGRGSARSSSASDLPSRLDACERSLAVAERLLAAHDEAERGRPIPMPEHLKQRHTPDQVRAMLESLAQRCQLGAIQVQGVECEEYPCLATVAITEPDTAERLLSCKDQGTELIGAIGEATRKSEGQTEALQVWSIHDRALLAEVGPDEIRDARESWRSSELLLQWAEGPDR